MCRTSRLTLALASAMHACNINGCQCQTVGARERGGVCAPRCWVVDMVRGRDVQISYAVMVPLFFFCFLAFLSLPSTSLHPFILPLPLARKSWWGLKFILRREVAN